MQDLLVLWDAIFADSIAFDLVDYVFLAMMLYLRDACEYVWIVCVVNTIGSSCAVCEGSGVQIPVTFVQWQ